MTAVDFSFTIGTGVFMFKWLYIINSAISYLIFLYYFETTQSKINQKQVLLLVFTSLSSILCTFSVFTKTAEALLLFYILYYIAIIMSLVIMLLLIIEMCGYRHNKYLHYFLFAYSTAIILGLSTTSVTGLYYKSYSLASFHGASYLTKEYGPLHVMLLILIGGINFASLGIVTYGVVKNKKLSRHTNLCLYFILGLAISMYIFPRIFKLQLDFLPLAFTGINLILIRIFRRAALYDMSANLLSTYEQRDEYGYICFDLNQRYMGANDFAVKIFPDLRKLRLDSKVPENLESIQKSLVHNIDRFISGSNEEVIHHSGEYSVIGTIKYIFNLDKKIGYLVELRDITKQQNYAEKLERDVAAKTIKISEMQESIITGMASMVESRDNSTGGHIKRTSAGVKVFLEAINKSGHYPGLTEDLYKSMIKAAPMHDLGKIAVDDAILRKPGKFEPEEYEKMKKHSAEGARIVSEVLKNVEDEKFKKIAVNVAHYHHEKWNGTGYPCGLKEDSIPLEARIMAFADVFDALVSKRCYKDAFTYDRAFEIIKNDSGTHFDPELSEIFMTCRPQLEKLYSSLEE